VRAGVALFLPFVDAVWQIYVLIFVLQSASAAFTPTFQATIPDILPDEEQYIKALSLSRLAYDLESLISPMLAAALLAVISFHWLFAGTSIAFAISAILVMTTIMPHRKAAVRSAENVWRKTTRGMRIYLKTPRLLGLLAITLAAAAGSAMVIINTVVIVKSMSGNQQEIAYALAAYGAGSMLTALLLPRILGQFSDRTVMLAGATAMSAALLALGLVAAGEPSNRLPWPPLILGWIVMGSAYALCVTPGGRLLRRSSADDDRPALFAAQFALSHVCWLVAYPVAGQVGASLGMSAAFLLLAVIAAIGSGWGIWVWPSADPDAFDHAHPDLPPDHAHLASDENGAHTHKYVIDDLHRAWPDRG